ncbi:hypothetical protein BLOT_014473 [Blomia tropicalis]|nr:hypothetical protein BLOT_014473 [Blomia tropicalis]
MLASNTNTIQLYSMSTHRTAYREPPYATGAILSHLPYIGKSQSTLSLEEGGGGGRTESVRTSPIEQLRFYS